MGKALGIILAAIVIIGAGVYLMNRPEGEVQDNTNVTTTPTQPQNVAQGRAIFSVTDAAVNMSTISEINMEVSQVSVHNATSGWAVVSTTPRTYGLLALNAKNESDLLADIRLPAGTYDQVRLMINSVVVKTKAGATKVAKLPSGELKINTIFVVNADQTSSLNFDFLADKSLHVTTANGEYIFAPVVKTESRSNADVTINGDNSVLIVGGTKDDSSTEGMDIDGTVKTNFQIDSSQKLDIDANNMIKLNGATSSGVKLN
ncbi:MAG: DUF4382 domain-containing protein [Candidatus Paceibacterota bacterium]